MCSMVKNVSLNVNRLEASANSVQVDAAKGKARASDKQAHGKKGSGDADPVTSAPVRQGKVMPCQCFDVFICDIQFPFLISQNDSGCFEPV